MILGAGAACAQPYQQSGPPQYAHQHRHFGAVSLIKEEMHAGRISQREGDFLVKKIHEMHAEKRAEREAYEGRGQGTPPRGQEQMQEPR